MLNNTAKTIAVAVRVSLKVVEFSVENFHSIKAALGLTERRVSIRTIRQELFQLDDQQEIFFRDYSVEQLRQILFQADNQDTLV